MKKSTKKKIIVVLGVFVGVGLIVWFGIFRKVGRFDTRKFEKKNYLFAIPQEDILRVEKLVQNPGWGIE